MTRPTSESRSLVLPVLGMAVACLLASACASSSATSSTSGARESPHPTLLPTGRTYSLSPPTPVTRDGWTVRPLRALSPNASFYTDRFSGTRLGVAVAVTSQRTLYTLHGNEEFTAESMAKVPIMLAFLEDVANGGPGATAEEAAALELMIRQSDNAAADGLWNAVGGARGVGAAMSRAGFDGLDFDAETWGDSVFTPADISTLFAALIEGEAFDDTTRETAIGLLGEVVPWQRWGALAGVPYRSTTGIKNGWYEEADGWAMNSAAFVQPESGSDYTIAIFTAGNSNYFRARGEIEGIASAIHRDIFLRQVVRR